MQRWKMACRNLLSLANMTNTSTIQISIVLFVCQMNESVSVVVALKHIWNESNFIILYKWQGNS